MSNLKVEGKARDICPNCKNCICHNHEFTNGIDTITAYTCEDPYDGLKREIVGDDTICCSMFELKPEMSHIPLLQHELEMEKLRMKIHQLEKEKAAHLKGIEHLKKSNNDLKGAYNHLLETIKKENEAGSKIVEDNVTLEREKSELIKATKRKDELIQSYREKSKNYEQILIDISRFVPVDVTDFKDLPRIIEQMRKTGDMYDSVSESYDALFDQKYELQKANEKLEDKVHKLERRLLEENKRFARLDSEFLIPLAHVLYPREAKICKPYSEVIEDIKRLVDKSEILEQRYDNIHYTLYKDWSDDSISCPRDIPSDVEMIEDLKKRAADSDYYKEKSELLEERNNNQFDTISEKNKKIGELEEKLKKANELADSWKRDYEFVRDRLIHPIYDILYPDNPNRDINVTDLINNVKDLKVYEDENKSMYEDLKYWRERCHGAETDVTILNSKVETLKNKNTELNQTTSDQEITIKALLITIKEMCKDE